MQTFGIDDIARLKAVADEIRSVWPEKAAAIDAAVAQLAAGERDAVTVRATLRWRLDKYEGPAGASEPFETITGMDRLLG